jgi:hypothetical protein
MPTHDKKNLVTLVVKIFHQAVAEAKKEISQGRHVVPTNELEAKQEHILFINEVVFAMHIKMYRKLDDDIFLYTEAPQNSILSNFNTDDYMFCVYVSRIILNLLMSDKHPSIHIGTHGEALRRFKNKPLSSKKDLNNIKILKSVRDVIKRQGLCDLDVCESSTAAEILSLIESEDCSDTKKKETRTDKIRFFKCDDIEPEELKVSSKGLFDGELKDTCFMEYVLKHADDLHMLYNYTKFQNTDMSSLRTYVSKNINDDLVYKWFTRAKEHGAKIGEEDIEPHLKLKDATVFTRPCLITDRNNNTPFQSHALRAHYLRRQTESSNATQALIELERTRRAAVLEFGRSNKRRPSCKNRKSRAKRSSKAKKAKKSSKANNKSKKAKKSSKARKCK